MIPRTLLALAMLALVFMGALSACTRHQSVKTFKNESPAVRAARADAETVREWRIRP